MITRLWRGWTATENADPYARFLLTELFPQMREIPGFLGADVLRSAEGDEVAFVTLTRFETLDRFDATAGPADFQAIGLRRVSQPEVNPKIVLRQIARSRFHFSNKNLSPDGKL